MDNDDDEDEKITDPPKAWSFVGMGTVLSFPMKESLIPQITAILWPCVKHTIFKREIMFKWVLSATTRLYSFPSFLFKKQNSKSWIDLEAREASHL